MRKHSHHGSTALSPQEWGNDAGDGTNIAGNFAGVMEDIVPIDRTGLFISRVVAAEDGRDNGAGAVQDFLEAEGTGLDSGRGGSTLAREEGASIVGRRGRGLGSLVLLVAVLAPGGLVRGLPALSTGVVLGAMLLASTESIIASCFRW